MPIKLAYYCSGHGYGHATRVSAFASALLSLPEKPQVLIVSSAPKRVFAECVKLDAQYRRADIDPIVVQPVAYTVDRQKSVVALQRFLDEKEQKLQEEVAWLLSEGINCVLSDAAFLGCEAATKACIPSMLVTNFTFDTVYSYLGVDFRSKLNDPDGSLQAYDNGFDNDLDTPIPPSILDPLVSQLHMGYRHADVLLLLPGHIPIPSFFLRPPLPASRWIDTPTRQLLPNIIDSLSNLDHEDLYPSIPFPPATSLIADHSLTVKFPLRQKPCRKVKYIPLLVRPISGDVGSCAEKRRVLSSIGVPQNIQDSPDTRILVVSFGGQVIHRPSGKTPSGTPSPRPGKSPGSSSPILSPAASGEKEPAHAPLDLGRLRRSLSISHKPPAITVPRSRNASVDIKISSDFNVNEESISETNQEELISSLPSESWIAIICGVSGNWSTGSEEDSLPPNFYIAPPDVYMPDLTAVADVLLGKLGYGTVSECIAAGTPLVYVSRPLFVEEHGLKLWLEAEGTGVELSKEEYESGQWAVRIQQAFERGKGRRGMDCTKNNEDIRGVAQWVLDYIRAWQRGDQDFR